MTEYNSPDKVIISITYKGMKLGTEIDAQLVSDAKTLHNANVIADAAEMIRGDLDKMLEVVAKDYPSSFTGL